jgi:hypothetical protein
VESPSNDIIAGLAMPEAVFSPTGIFSTAFTTGTIIPATQNREIITTIPVLFSFIRISPYQSTQITRNLPYHIRIQSIFNIEKEFVLIFNSRL